MGGDQRRCCLYKFICDPELEKRKGLMGGSKAPRKKERKEQGVAKSLYY